MFITSILSVNNASIYFFMLKFMSVCWTRKRNDFKTVLRRTIHDYASRKVPFMHIFCEGTKNRNKKFTLDPNCLGVASMISWSPFDGFYTIQVDNIYFRTLLMVFNYWAWYSMSREAHERPLVTTCWPFFVWYMFSRNGVNHFSMNFSNSWILREVRVIRRLVDHDKYWVASKFEQ